MTHKGLAPPRVYPVFIASIDLTLLCNRVYFPHPTPSLLRWLSTWRIAESVVEVSSAPSGPRFFLLSMVSYSPSDQANQSLTANTIAQAEKEGGRMGLDLLSMQCLWHDIVNRKLPWLWHSTLHFLRRTQADALTRSTSPPDTCDRRGDNRASASSWCPLGTFSAIRGRAVGLTEAHESIELLEFAPSRCASSPRPQYTFSMPDDDSFYSFYSFYSRLSRLTIRITTIPVYAADCPQPIL
jgi:hypothetical protein